MVHLQSAFKNLCVAAGRTEFQRHRRRIGQPAGGSKLSDSMLNALQWPAMAATLLSAWFVACQSKPKRSAGFWLFMLSNALWIAWGLHDGAYALIALQVGLFFLNLRGVQKNESQ